MTPVRWGRAVIGCPGPRRCTADAHVAVSPHGQELARGTTSTAMPRQACKETAVQQSPAIRFTSQLPTCFHQRMR